MADFHEGLPFYRDGARDAAELLLAKLLGVAAKGAVVESVHGLPPVKTI
jgi:hypothetical protein